MYPSLSLYSIRGRGICLLQQLRVHGLYIRDAFIRGLPIFQILIVIHMTCSYFFSTRPYLNTLKLSGNGAHEHLHILVHLQANQLEIHSFRSGASTFEKCLKQQDYFSELVR